MYHYAKLKDEGTGAIFYFLASEKDNFLRIYTKEYTYLQALAADISQFIINEPEDGERWVVIQFYASLTEIDEQHSEKDLTNLIPKQLEYMAFRYMEIPQLERESKDSL